MDIQDRKGLRIAGDAALGRAQYDPKKLILIHAGASALVMLLITLANYYLQTQIAETGGLSGMGLRSILSTISQVLQLAANMALPFWSIGYTAAMLAIARGQSAVPQTLLEGFRRFGPVLRLLLVQDLIVFVLAMFCLYPAAMIFMLTPLSQPMVEAMLPLMSQTADVYALMEDPVVISAMSEASVPIMAIFLILFGIIAIPLFFRLRFSQMALMDDPAAGAFAALIRSWICTRRRCGKLLRLDLCFWWFYVLDGLIAVLAFGDTLLRYLGIDTGIDPQLLYLIFYVLYLAAQMVLYYFAKNQIQVTYSLAYDAIKDTQALPKAPDPKNVPWSYYTNS